MTDPQSYESRVQSIRDANQPIIASFQAWLEQSGLTDKTVRSHVNHIYLFAEFLVYYDDPLKRLDQAQSGDVRSFFTYWFPRKVMYDGYPSPKPYIASIKKFFQWMGKTHRIPPETLAQALATLKKDRDEFLKAGARHG